MKGKIKTSRKKGSKLYGSTAQFVSLVDMGANETPFTIVKSRSQGVKAMPITKRGKTAKSHKTVGTGRKSAKPETRTETMIAKMVFSADYFEDEDAVLEYIEEAEWDASQVKIEKDEEGNFIARASDLTDDDFEKIGKVETDTDGVEAFVGQRVVEVKTDDADDEGENDEAASDEDEDETLESKEDANEGEEDGENAEKGSDKGKKKPGYKKAADKTDDNPKSKRAEFLAKRKQEKQRKFDMWDARFSNGNTLAKTLSDGMSWDAVPPGYYEVQSAFNAAVANIVSGEGMPEGGKQEALNKTAMDYAEIIGGLDTFFDQYIEANEDTVTAAITKPEEREALSKWAEQYSDFIVSEGETPAPAKVAKGKGSNDNAALAIDYSTLSESVAKSVAASLAPVIEQVEGVSTTVEKMASRHQTKKAADPEDSGNAGPRTIAQNDGEDAASRFAKSFLG